jgi:hypothetical protein
LVICIGYLKERTDRNVRRYVTEEWLPHHVMEVTTREAYTYQIGKHTLPWFGPMKMKIANRDLNGSSAARASSIRLKARRCRAGKLIARRRR